MAKAVAELALPRVQQRGGLLHYTPKGYYGHVCNAEKSGKDKYSGLEPKDESSTSEHPEAHHVEIVILQNSKEASVSPEKGKWFIAMKEEIVIMSERNTWEN
ncbi:hypothetical protein TNCV_5069721 [Trichonephila clavipes]|nr:hypothetical protein TNCV_5069721 [Trichonephila clavipes]